MQTPSHIRVDHIAIVVKALDHAIPFYSQALGLQLERVEDLPAEGVKIAFLLAGDSGVELLEPTVPDTGVARFLGKRGEGLHHICMEVEDIQAVLDRLAAAGAELIGTPQQHPDGTLYAFIHPKSAHGVLLELYQKP
ncbi:MAG: methylmalonyl-CoA epimerase [Chloroflexi bacterium]|nr:methylmalonyl-CoA epimerase [Chloroflexota bacterium]